MTEEIVGCCDFCTTIVSPECGDGRGKHFCEDVPHTCPPTCEIETTVDDTDDGGPYDFKPCKQPVTKTIQWTTPGGMTITLGVCDFHATGEL